MNLEWDAMQMQTNITEPTLICEMLNQNTDGSGKKKIREDTCKKN